MFDSIAAARVRFAQFFIALILLAPAAQAQWKKIASFPEPAEELLGAAATGKMNDFAGFIPFWHPKGLVYEYDPASDKWTKKKSMALPSHHVAFTEYKGKIYSFGGFVYPQSGPASWVPIDKRLGNIPETDGPEAALSADARQAWFGSEPPRSAIRST